MNWRSKKKPQGYPDSRQPAGLGGPLRSFGFRRPAALEPLTPGVTGIQVVPEFDVLLVLLPTQEHLVPANDSREINQPAINVLDLDFPSLELQEYLLRGRPGF